MEEFLWLWGGVLLAAVEVGWDEGGVGWDGWGVRWGGGVGGKGGKLGSGKGWLRRLQRGS